MKGRETRKAPKRILVVSDHFPHPGKPHLGAFVANQVKAVSGRAEVTVIAPIRISLRAVVQEGKSAWPAFSLQRVQYGATVLHPVYFGLGDRLSRWEDIVMTLSVIWAVLSRGVRFDWVHAHFALPGGYAAGWLSRLWRKPLFVTAHGYDIDIYLNTKDAPAYGPRGVGMKKRYRELRVRSVLDRAKKVLTVSNCMFDKLLEVGVAREKLRMVGNGVNADVFVPRDQALCRKQLGWDRNAPTILFVGSLSERKGVLDLLEAAEKVLTRTPQVRLILIGDGVLEGSIRRRIEESGLRGWVKLLEPVPEERLALCMAAADLLVLPSYYESYGCVLMEAMACGTPVVATTAGAVPELVREGVDGLLVPPGDPDALAQALGKGLRRTWDRGRIREHAASQSWDAVGERVLSAFFDVDRNEGTRNKMMESVSERLGEKGEEAVAQVETSINGRVG